MTGGGILSCSSDEGRGIAPDEAGSEEAGAAEAGGPSFDAGAQDALPAPHEAGAFDGGPLPVVCDASPCATSLVTTLGLDARDINEGFCALLDDGTVACWGANNAGQLGRGDDAGTADSMTAARVVGLSDVVQLHHTCALDRSGSVWCWGTGPFLRSGDGQVNRTQRMPMKLALTSVKSVGIGNDVGCAVVDDSGLLCWGANTFGQVAPFDLASSSATLAPRLINFPPGAPIRDIVIGDAVFVSREDGVTVSWGANVVLARPSSLNPDPYPYPTTLGRFSSIDLAGNAACAIVEGVGYCWGHASNYHSGAPAVDRVQPTPVATPEPVVQIATTRARYSIDDYDHEMRTASQPQRWCAVGASGAVYCWGYNASGQAGDGTKEHAIEAVKVQGLSEPVSQVRTMPDSTCAVSTSGKVYCWGSNYNGQLGGGKIRVPSLVPQEVTLP